MQIQFKSTDGIANTHCCVCGQGFELMWERRSVPEVTKVLFEIQKNLCNHHREQTGPQAHPESGVLIPEWALPKPVHNAAQGNAQECAL
jgi:hypothetical protein